MICLLIVINFLGVWLLCFRHTLKSNSYNIAAWEIGFPTCWDFCLLAPPMEVSGCFLNGYGHPGSYPSLSRSHKRFPQQTSFEKVVSLPCRKSLTTGVSNEVESENHLSSIWTVLEECQVFESSGWPTFSLGTVVPIWVTESTRWIVQLPGNTKDFYCEGILFESSTIGKLLLLARILKKTVLMILECYQ